MPKVGRPTGKPAKGSITRAMSIPAEIYKKCIWIADRWTRESLSETADGSENPEYWTVPRVIASVMNEYFTGLEAQDPEIVLYFERCRERDEKLKSISKSPSQPKPLGY